MDAHPERLACYLDAEVCIIIIPVCVLHFGRRWVESAGLFCTHFATFCVQKRKGRGSRREQKALCQQLSREEQQRMKEIESGLFINEVRISVTNEDEDEEDDGSDVSIDWPRLAVYIGFSSMQKCVYEVCVLCACVFDRMYGGVKGSVFLFCQFLTSVLASLLTLFMSL